MTIDELRKYCYDRGVTYNRDEIAGLLASVTSGDLGPATVTTVPGTVSSGKSFSFKDLGTYTNFKDASNNPIVVPVPAANHVFLNGKLYFNGTYWSAFWVDTVTSDLTNYYQKSQTDDKLSAISGVNPAYAAAPNNDYSLITSSYTNGVNYYNNWDNSAARTINKIRIKFTDAG